MANLKISQSSEGQTFKLIDETVAVGTRNSDIIESEGVHDVKVQWVTKGANTTGVLQGSIDGVNFYDLQTLNAGGNPSVKVVEPFIRVQLNQTTSPELNTVWIFAQIG